MTTAADDGRELPPWRVRFRAELDAAPPLSDDDLAAIAAAIAPGWVLADDRAKPRRKAKP